MTGQAVEQAVSRVPVPQFLRDVGVQILEDTSTGARIVAIPREVRQRCNVIDPVTSLVQADPNWSPRISVCELDPAKNGPHFYEQAGRKLAPTKQALETLAKAAGILYTRTERVPRGELDADEIGYRATIGIRRSDGTVEEVRREKVWVKEAERQEIEDAVTAARAYDNGQRTDKPRFDVPGTDQWNAEVNKRWLREVRDRYAKTESKAVLRAIRAALQIPHTFSPQEAAKPFLVVGFNFTPDYDDAETKRILVAAGLNAQAAIYGPGGTTATDRIDSTTGEVTSPDSVDDSAPDPADVGTPQQAGETVSDSPSSEDLPDSPAPEDEDDYVPEDEPDTATFVEQIPIDEGRELQERAETAGAVVVPSNRPEFKGKTIAQVADMGTEGEKYLHWVLTHPDWETRDDRKPIFTAAWTYCSIMVPDLKTRAEETLAARVEDG